MKLRVLISILFIIATTFTALHEIEHITGEHDSSSCQVCVVDDHSVSADIVDTHIKISTFSFDSITTNQLFKTHTKKTANHSNAPPKFS